MPDFPGVRPLISRPKMKKTTSSIVPLLFCAGVLPVQAEDFTSNGSGTWESGNPALWSPAGSPRPGEGDTVTIGNGHQVIYNHYGDGGVGIPGSGDFGAAGGGIVTINGGGVLSQSSAGSWIRLGQTSTGTLQINEGRFHFTNGIADNSDERNFFVGSKGGTGIINVGDGSGATAVLNLRDTTGGTAHNVNVHLNLGADDEVSGDHSGHITINQGGLLEGAAIVRGTGAQNPHIRVGQHASANQSVLRVNAGGQANVRGSLEVGANGGAQGLVHLTGQNARLDQYDGDFTIGYNGTGTMLVENGAVYTRHNTIAARMDLFVGRANGTGTITLRSGGQFIQGAGSNVGDLRIGLSGTGTLNVEDSGVFRNDSGNWVWVGQNATGNGTINVREGGSFQITTGSNLNIGQSGNGTFRQTGGVSEMNGVIVGEISGTGLLDVQGGTFTARGNLNIGKNGNGTFRQTNGTSEVNAVYLAENNGTGIFDLQDGNFTARGSFFLGGAAGGSTGTGTAIGTQSGGTLEARAAFVVGLAGGHTGSYSLTGDGIINHTGSDISVGENGSGNLHIGEGATLNDTSAAAGSGRFFVGRNNGSSGTLTVDGSLIKTHGTEGIRVGNGNTDGADNTSATGLLQGTGEIEAAGVRIGTLGTITGGTNTTVGHLTITGNLGFSAGGRLLANFGGSSGVDRLSVNGTVDISGAILSGDWLAGGPTGPDSRYWLILNDGNDSIVGGFANVVETSPSAVLFPDADGFITFGDQEFAVFYGADHTTNSFTGGNDLLLSAIPEPGTTALLLLAGLAAGTRRRR